MAKQPLHTIIGILLVLFSLGTIIWGFDKAFDFSDAGYYVLRYQDAQPVEFGGHMYEHILLRALLPSAMRRLIPLRFLGLLLNLFATTYLASSIYLVLSYRRSKAISFPFIFLAAFSGFIASYAGSPSELSYNSLNQFLLILFAASMLLATAGKERYHTLFSAISAIPLAFILAVKLPTALGGLIIGSVVLLCSKQHKLRNLLAFILAWLGTATLLNLLIQPGMIAYYGNFYRYLSKYIIYDTKLLVKSLMDIAKLNLYAMLQALVVLLLARITLLTGNKGMKLTASLAALGMLLYVTATGIYSHLQGEMLLSGFLLFYVYLSIGYLLLPPSLHLSTTAKAVLSFLRDNYLYIILIGMLLYLPYLGALGSSNPLNWGAKYYYSMLLGGFSLLLGLFFPAKAIRYAAYIMLYVLFFGLFQYVQHPYRSQPLYMQNNAYKGIKYDLPKWAFLTQTEGILLRYGFTPQQGIIAVYKHPGLVYALGSFEPGTVLWSRETEDLYFAILAKSDTPSKPVLLSLAGELKQEFIHKLELALNVKFTRDYRLVASYPSYTKGDMVFLYTPR